MVSLNSIRPLSLLILPISQAVVTIFIFVQSANANQVELNSTKGCVLVADISTGETVIETNKVVCSKQFYPCSTFKIPLALMAFDAGILKSEEQKLKWDGPKQYLPAWEKDHDSYSWLKESVVWFSQRITSELGLSVIKKYLNDFQYGNQDFSGGLTKAWLSSSLKISAREQLDFLVKLKKNQLSIRSEVGGRVISLLPEEIVESEFKIRGKTGSGATWMDPNSKVDPPQGIGWYVGYLEKEGKYFAFASVLTSDTSKGKFVPLGAEARANAVKAMRALK